MTRQPAIIQQRACDEYLAGLKLLDLPTDSIPQCHEVSSVLQEATGWALEPVPALISFNRFFDLLAHRKFPAATFIRTREEIDYLQEPDIFHEIVGHCPLLTHPAYAEFVEHYGQLGLAATPAERVLLARLFWFTIEFGLIHTAQGLRAYGGGILSSIGETAYAIDSSIPKRLPFDARKACETDYRIDVIQPIYFTLNSFDQLYQLAKTDIMALVREIQLQEKVLPKHIC
jgi:phenylalanine-4-hydroxylase